MGIIEELQNFLDQYKAQIREEADRLAFLSMPQITEELFALFEQTGNRLKYEEVYFTRRKLLAVFGMKALLEQQEENRVSGPVLKKLEEVMESICDEECWALPAHVDRRKDQWQVTVDLFAAETSQTMAELADRLSGELSPSLHTRIVKNIERRVFRPYFTSAVPYQGWERSDNNWNAVCAGSIGSACLHLMREQKEYLELCLERICDTLPFYVSGFAEDGACMEGLGYFTYGMTYFVDFALELYDYTLGKKDLLCGDWAGFRAGETDKRARMASFQSKCYFADGRTVSFSDGNSRDTFRVGLSCALASRFPQARIPNMNRAAGLLDDSCFRFAALKMDLFETRKYLEKLRRETAGDDCGSIEPGLEDTEGAVMDCGQRGKKKHKTAGAENAAGMFEILPAAQWCIGQSVSGVGMACKGGNNGESHNHNDLGHFLYEAGGVMLFTDLGAGEYTREYFGSGRYEILCNNSFGHSVPIVDGQGQLPGRGYACRSFWAQKSDEGRPEGRVCMELAGAYEEGLLQSFRRSLRFSLEDGSLIVCDRFEVSAGRSREVTENLVTQIPPVIRKGEVVLESGGVTAILSMGGDLGETDITVREYSHSSHIGQPEKVFAIRWKVPVDDGSGCSSFRIICEHQQNNKYLRK